MTATFLSPNDDKWTAILRNVRHDVYHRPEYLRATSVHEAGTPVAFYAEDQSGFLLCPLLLREIPDTERNDATSPYGYPAPLWTPSDPTSHWTAFLTASQNRGVVSAFIRLHPLLPVPSSAQNLNTSVALVEHGPTVWIDCTQSPEALWEDTRPDHRSDIRRLRRRGYQVEVSDESSPTAELLPAFVRLYRQTMDRVDADAFYDFSDDYFRAWTKALDPYCQIAVVRDEEGEPAAAGLFTEVDGWMQYHLSGTAKAHRKLAPSKLMIHEMRHRAHDAGNDRLHLGGGLDAAEDSIFDFKAGFSSTRASFQSLRIVCDRDAYRSLSGKESLAPSEGFFPSYRD